MRLSYVFVFVLAVFAGCVSAQTGGSPSEKIIGTVWYLEAIKTPSGMVNLGRAYREAEGMKDIFSLRFDGQSRLSGKGAPNSYTAECTWGDNASLSIGTAAATRMLAFREPEVLKEQEFFNYLAAVKRYRLTSAGRLELTAKPDGGGQEVTLIFVRQQ